MPEPSLALLQKLLETMLALQGESIARLIGIEDRLERMLVVIASFPRHETGHIDRDGSQFPEQDEGDHSSVSCD